MPVRLVAAGALIVLVLAACGGAPSTSGPATGPVATAAAIDLSQVDVCAIVPEGTAEALTGETGFTADGSSSASGARCFWGVPRAGVPQYLEVEISPRTASLQGYGISPEGNPCPGVIVPGVGVEAVGGVCTSGQTKVWLAAMAQGVVVQVLVNEPKGALTPAGLADAVNGILTGLR